MIILSKFLISDAIIIVTIIITHKIQKVTIFNREKQLKSVNR